MSRLEHLSTLCLKVIETIAEEKAQPLPSEAVLKACQMARDVIMDEYAEILRHRQKARSIDA